MEKIKKEDFETWLKSCNWFKINEVGTPNGPQDHYVTPAGEIMIALYDLSGELQHLVKPVPPPPQATVMRRLGDLRGGGQLPPGLTG